MFDETDDIGNVESEDVSFLMCEPGRTMRLVGCEATRVSLVFPGDLD